MATFFRRVAVQGFAPFSPAPDFVDYQIVSSSAALITLCKTFPDVGFGLFSENFWP
jgi:hypothetical protein